MLPSIRVNWGLGIALCYSLFALATVAFVMFAMSRPVELVSVDYYRQSLAHDTRLEAIGNAHALGAALQVTVDAGERTATIRLPAEAAAGATGTVTMYRPAEAAADRERPVSIAPDGSQRVSLDGLARGRWLLRLEWQSRGRVYYHEQPVVVP